MSKRLSIIYHSQSGRAERLAFAFFNGAKRVGSVDSLLEQAEEATVDSLVGADAWVFLCAENFGEIAGGMKNFFDRVYYPFERESQKNNHDAMPYMLMLSAGNDGSFCEQKITRILSGLKAKKVQETRIFFGEPSKQNLAEAQSFGEAFATAIDIGAF